jgi:hypothetical protein
MDVHYKDYIRQWRLWLSFRIVIGIEIEIGTYAWHGQSASYHGINGNIVFPAHICLGGIGITSWALTSVSNHGMVIATGISSDAIMV